MTSQQFSCHQVLVPKTASDKLVELLYRCAQHVEDHDTDLVQDICAAIDEASEKSFILPIDMIFISEVAA